MKKQTQFTMAIALALFVFVAALGLIGIIADQPAAAAPPADPTPLANAAQRDTALIFTLYTDTITGDVSGNGIQLLGYETLDLQYVIDVSGAFTVTSLSLDHSNDNTNWATGAAISGSMESDGTEIFQLGNFGRYTRATIDTANLDSTTDLLTLTILAVAK